jgi:hypothetical protein
MIIQPDTLRWHRDLFQRVWKRKSKREGKGGRQQLRELTPFGESPRFLIRDNDDRFGDAFARVADGSGTEALTMPYQAPKAKGVCERFLGSVRRERLDFYLILSERHLYRTMKQYHAYFNHARPHKGINLLQLRRHNGSEMGETRHWFSLWKFTGKGYSDLKGWSSSGWRSSTRTPLWGTRSLSVGSAVNHEEVRLH